MKIRKTKSAWQSSRRLVRPWGSRSGLKKSSVWGGATTHMNIRTKVFFTERRNILEEPDAYELSSLVENKTTYVILKNYGRPASISNIHQNKEIPHNRGKTFC